MNAHEYALQANGSFALPDACFKVKALMEDDDSTIEDFADVISIDPSMTSRLLQIANSAIYLGVISIMVCLSSAVHFKFWYN